MYTQGHTDSNKDTYITIHTQTKTYTDKDTHTHMYKQLSGTYEEIVDSNPQLHNVQHHNNDHNIV